MSFSQYKLCYMPHHPKAMSNGCVYEHILVAEKILGRELADGECVHHKDENKKNNNPDNLMIFRTLRDHTAYHRGAEAVLMSDGVYEVLNFVGRYDICPVCNKNKKYITSCMCVECSNKLKKAKSKCPPREELKDKMIMYKNFKKVGQIYGVSDKTIAKWCLKLKLPNHINEWKAINT